MKKRTGDKESNFWQNVYDMHLYDIKGEGLFKAVIITFSWCGGVHMAKLPDKISVAIAASLFLFFIALIMEYAVRLVVTKKTVTRVLPLIVVVISLICTFLTFCELVERSFGVPLEWLYYATIIPQVVIWLDVVVQLLIDKPEVESIEKNLKEIEVS